jgi:hypothetical protein
MIRKSTSVKSRIRKPSARSKKMKSRASNETKNKNKNKNKSKAPIKRKTELELHKRVLGQHRLNKSRIAKVSKTSVKPRIRKAIVVRRSSGRREKFDTERLAQTVSRSGVPYAMARDIAKKTTRKIKSQVVSSIKKRPMNKAGKEKVTQRRQEVRSSADAEEVVVTAGQVRNIIAEELRDRNRPDIAASYTGDPPEQIELHGKPTDSGVESISNKVGAITNKALYDPSKQKRSS